MLRLKVSAGIVGGELRTDQDSWLLAARLTFDLQGWSRGLFHPKGTFSFRAAVTAALSHLNAVGQRHGDEGAFLPD